MTDNLEVIKDNQSLPHEDDEKGKKEDTEDRHIPKGEQTSWYMYRDFSNVKESELDDIPVASHAPPSRAGTETSIRVQKFPVKLYAILAQVEFNEVVTWMPHGRSWKVLKPQAFETLVMPLFFEYSNYHSFNRLINAWSFRRISAGRDRGSYYHELFLRGKPHLQNFMRRLPKSQKKLPMKKENEPNFYDTEKISTLPSLDESLLPVTSIMPPPRKAGMLLNKFSSPLLTSGGLARLGDPSVREALMRVSSVRDHQRDQLVDLRDPLAGLSALPPGLGARLGGMGSLPGMGGHSELNLGAAFEMGRRSAGLGGGGLVPMGFCGLGMMGNQGGGMNATLRESQSAGARLGELGDSFRRPSSSLRSSPIDRLRRIRELQALETGEMEHQLRFQR